MAFLLDDDDYDHRPQRRRYEEPLVGRIRRLLFTIAESVCIIFILAWLCCCMGLGLIGVIVRLPGESRMMSSTSQRPSRRTMRMWNCERCLLRLLLICMSFSPPACVCMLTEKCHRTTVENPLCRGRRAPTQQPEPRDCRLGAGQGE